MLRMELKNLTVAGLVAIASVAAPVAVSAQPYTIIATFINAMVDGADGDNIPDNPVTPIAPPAAPGAYGIGIFVARGGPGVDPVSITTPRYVSAATTRLYYSSAEISALAAPAGNNANLVSTGNNARRTTAAAPTISAVQADAGNFDSNANTTNFVVLNSTYNGGEPTAPLFNGGTPGLSLPQTWSYSNRNHAPGTFEVLYTVNVTTIAAASNNTIGITPNPQNGSFSGRLYTDGTTASGQAVFSDFTDGDPGDANPLAVDLASLTASVSGSTATISWSTAAEYDNAGFIVYRAEADGAQGEAISTLVAAEGSASAGASYSVVDPAAVAPGETRSYYLADIDLSGATTVHGPVSVTRGAASSVSGWELY